MRFRIVKGGKNDEDEEKRKEWLRDLGFEESYVDPDAKRKEKQPLLGEESEDALRRRFDALRAADMADRERVQWRAQERGLPFVDLDRVAVEAVAIACVPAEVARQYQVLPVKREGLNLWLAMADEQNIRAIDTVRETSGCRVYPVVAAPGAVAEAIDIYYRE